MINICKPNGKLIKSFKNDDAFNHLSAGELLEDHPEIGATQLGFIVFSPEMVQGLYFNLKQKTIPTPLKEVYEQQLGVIEIATNPTWVPMIQVGDTLQTQEAKILRKKHKKSILIRFLGRVNKHQSLKNKEKYGIFN